MSNVRVLIADAVSSDCDEIFRSRRIEVERAAGAPREELLKRVRDVDGMVVRSAVTVDREMIDAMARMRVIGRAGAGVDNIDVVAATERGVIVMNTPEGNTISAAEHTVAMLLAMLRRIPAANASMRASAWDRKSFLGTELMGKTVGVIGLGRIGREVARRVASFNVAVIGYDPMLSAEAVYELGVRPATFDELIESSDILSVHVPLVAETRGMIGEETIEKMKNGAFVVNCARGGVVDEAALLKGLDSGRIAGAALDVFESEPPTFPSALIEHPRVVATPHIAASTYEAQQRVALDIASQMADLFEGKGAQGIVNARGLERSLRSDVVPLMRAAEQLGVLLGQLVGNRSVDCQLRAYGAEATSIARGLGAAFLSGMLSLGADERVNAINAELLAANNNIRLAATGEGTHHHYSTLVVAEATNAETGVSRSAAATVFGRRETRLVGLDGVWFDIRPAGSLLIFENIDQPGVLATVGEVLARHGLNIADVSLGRREGEGRALTVMRIDSRPSDAAISELGALTTVERVHVLSFEG